MGIEDAPVTAGRAFLRTLPRLIEGLDHVVGHVHRGGIAQELAQVARLVDQARHWPPGADVPRWASRFHRSSRAARETPAAPGHIPWPHAARRACGDTGVSSQYGRIWMVR